MVRRKGELSSSAIDRGWPHQVMLPELRGEMWTGRWPSICPRHHTVVWDGRWQRIYCFADPGDAESFLRMFEQFGAVRFDPKRRRGRGGWAQIKPEP
jgi:hypothetical protein